MDRRIPPAANVGPPEDFAQEILREFHFGADYDFGREFSFGGYDSSSSVGSFDYDGISIEYSEELNWECRRHVADMSPTADNIGKIWPIGRVADIDIFFLSFPRKKMSGNDDIS